MAKAKAKELTRASLGAKNCTCLVCVPRADRISHSEVWKMSKKTKTCPLKDGVEV
jgi:hypothetical protein